MTATARPVPESAEIRSARRGYANVKAAIDAAVGYDVVDYGADPTGAADSTDEINAACAAAKAAGGRVVGKGTFLISGTVTIRCDADFSLATFTTTSTSLAPMVRVGGYTAGAPDTYLVVRTPALSNGHSAPTWGSDTGVSVDGFQRSVLHVQDIAGFDKGLEFTGSEDGAGGVSYITVYLSTLINRRNIYIDPTSATSYANEIVFIGGCGTINSGEGAQPAGSRHVFIGGGAGTATYQPNSFRFIGTAFEGKMEHYFEIGGSAVRFIDCRYEAGSNEPMRAVIRKIGAANPSWIRFDGGAGVGNLIIIDDYSAVSVAVDHSSRTRRSGYSPAAVFELTNSYSNTANAIAVTSNVAGIGGTMLAAAASIGDTNVKVDYVPSSRFAAGQTVTLGVPGNTETLVIDTVGTGGSGGTGITFTGALTLDHGVYAPLVPDASASWRFGVSALYTRWKADTHANPVLQVANTSGALGWGDGTNALDINLARYSADVLKLDDQLRVAGLALPAKAGAPEDADVVGAVVNQLVIVDTTNSRLYVRVGGTWKYAALT